MDQSPELRRGLEVVAGSLVDVVEAGPDVVANSALASVEDSALASDEEALDVESSAMEHALDVAMPDSVVNWALASVEDSLPDSIELVPDSADVVPDTVEVAPYSDVVALDAVDFVPDTDEVVQCPRCGTPAASSEKPATKLAGTLAGVHVVVFYMKITTGSQARCMARMASNVKSTFPKWTSFKWMVAQYSFLSMF